ncbi:minor capsid protein [Metabacillus fastidiosus]|uniref:minor capsid protein n=1 Tax=Metabacillus fastidiosus TaxID=1458 RepID=UPI003D277FC9
MDLSHIIAQQTFLNLPNKKAYLILPQPSEDEELDSKVLARRQKDLDGYIVEHQSILEQRAEEFSIDLQKVWDRISSAIVKEIKAIYNAIQDAQGVPITRTPISRAKFRNMRRQLLRLRQLEKQLINLMNFQELRTRLARNIAFTYTESYYFHAFAVEQAARVAVVAPVLTAGHVVGVMINPWLPDGRTYSDRLRANTEYLAKKMVETVERAMGSGWSINRTAREIQNNAQEGYYNSVRLARTEMTRAAAQGANHVYMQNVDIMDGKRWNAVLDARTAPKDAQNDGEIFPLSYDTPENLGVAGKRIPNHPNCRCKWSPVLSALGISVRERIARGPGDSKKKFGARTYTQARTYKEYARERGLPDVDEAVRNENPSKYLRRGETSEDIPADFFGVA